MKKVFFLVYLFFCAGIITTQAQFSDIYQFTGAGAYPYGSLTLSGSKFYGMTSAGGAEGVGCIFSIDTNGNEFKTLFSFDGGYPIQGQKPLGSLTLSGNKLYGMTSGGGPYSDGNVFSIDTNGNNYTILLIFNGAKGENANGSLILSGGKLFGMTYQGGTKIEGNVFTIDTNGGGYKDLLDFTGANGSGPYGSLTISGNVLYGMTYNGGANNDGVIFSIDTNGKNYKDVYDFNGTKGANPAGSLTLSGSVLYGMTHFGGAHDSGCVFSIDTNGKGYKVLFDFNKASGSYHPQGSLIQSGNVLYGMTSGNSIDNGGSIFSIDTNGNGY